MFNEVSRNLNISCKNISTDIHDKQTEIIRLAKTIGRFIDIDAPNYSFIDSMIFDNLIVDNFTLFDVNKNIALHRYDQNKSIGENDPNFKQQIFQFSASAKTNSWAVSVDTLTHQFYTHLLYRVNKTKVMLITQSQTEAFYNYFSNFDIEKDGFPIVFNSERFLIYHPLVKDSILKELGDIPQNFIRSFPDNDLNAIQQSNEGIVLKNTYPHNNDEKYLSYVIYDSNVGWFITVNQPYSVVYTDMFEYIRQTGFWFIIIGLILITIVVLTNNFITRPFRAIVATIKNNQFVSLKYASTTNEATVIRKAFDVLQNQLAYYVKLKDQDNKNETKLVSDLKLAKLLQKNMLPANFPAFPQHTEFDIYAISESAFDIGGDLYDFFFIDKNRLLVAVGDVAGKGIPASLFMIFTHSMLRSVSSSNKSTSEIVEILNEKLIEENVSDLFVTLFLAVLDIETGELTYTNAAHCAPLLIQNNGQIKALNETHGIPIGIYGGRSYKQSKIQLMNEDTLFIYTDGLTDTKDENGLNYTEDVLRYNLVGSWFFKTNELVNKVENSISNFRGTVAPVDDMTILVIKYRPSYLTK